MALDYCLLVRNPNNELEPTCLKKDLLSTFHFQDNQISDFLVTTGLTLSIFKKDDEYDKSFFNSSHPDICLSFRVDKFEQYEVGIITLLKTTSWLISHLNEDMILLFNNEYILLQKSADQLTLNEDPEFWLPSRISLINLPYQFAEIPSL